MLTSILIGLIGLGLVVLIHEYGHLLLAKIVGVDVKVFSIGWGRRLWSFMHKGTEYRISMFPIGGYVKLKGEEELAKAYAERAERVASVENGFFDVAPWRRIAIAIGGPAFNVIAALIIFIIILTIGYNVSTYGNRIVLASELDSSEYAADKAGLESGDRITAINGEETDYFFQIRRQVIEASGKPIEITVERNGERLALHTNGEVDSNTGFAILGVHAWVDPVVESVVDGEGAEIAGILAGDRITTVNGEEIEHTAQFSYLLQQNSTAIITILRDTTKHEFRVAVGEGEGGAPNIGITFSRLQTRISAGGFGQAISQATGEVVSVFTLTIKGISSLFSGGKVRNTIAGPIQLTSIIGDVAKSGGGEGGWAVIRLFFNFLAIVNVALCFMNLLPIPILDGGQILLYAVESVRRKALRPRTIVRYQQVGAVCILLLMVLALTSDFLFLFN